MTPAELSEHLRAALGRPVRLRPVPDHPYAWQATIAGVGDRAALLDSLGRRAYLAGDLLTVRLTDQDVLAALGESVAAVCPALTPPPPPRSLVATRDGRLPLSDNTLTERVGGPAARWAVLRSADGVQVDVALEDLASLTPANPVFPVLRAVAVTRRGTAPAGHGAALVAAGVAQWPLLLADWRRTHRSRPVAQHVEALAGHVLTWAEQPPGSVGPPAPWTGEPLWRASRIVLEAALCAAGIDPPHRI